MKRLFWRSLQWMWVIFWAPIIALSGLLIGFFYSLFRGMFQVWKTFSDWLADIQHWMGRRYM